MSDRPNAPSAPAAPLTPAEIHAWLDFDLEPLRARREELLAASARWLAAHDAIDNDDAQGEAAENRRMISALLKAAEDRRKERKEPFLEGGRAVDAWFNGTKLAPSKGFSAALERLRGQFTALMTPYAERKAEEARLAAAAIAREAEEKAQRAVEAAIQAMGSAPPADVDVAVERATEATAEAAQAERGAAASLADRSRVHGEFGAVASLRTRWKYRITDEALIPRELMSPDPAKINAAIVTAGKDADGTPKAKLGGITIYAERSV
jgi:hypothetical protein